MSLQDTEKMEAEFSSMINNSWKIYNNHFWNTAIDEVMIGAVINATLEKGYVLIDVESRAGYNHLMRFENIEDHSRVLYSLRRRTTGITDTKVMGCLADITIGYGAKARSITDVFKALKEEFKSSFVDANEPGIITFDAEQESGYVYGKVPLIMNINDYMKDNNILNIDYTKLNYQIECALHSLKKYLIGRNLIGA